MSKTFEQLLEEYLFFLSKNGYVDDDAWQENTIEQFFKERERKNKNSN